MERVSVVQSRGRWFRSGEWCIVWRDFSQFEREAIERFFQTTVAGTWFCEVQGSSDILPQARLRTSDGYDPINDTPGLYLAFASLGRSTWETFDERYLGDFGRGLQQPIPENLTEQVIDFHVGFGPPVERYSTLGSWNESVYSMLRYAQVIDLMVEYQRVISSETSIGTLRRRVSAVKEEARAQSAALERRLAERKSTDGQAGNESSRGESPAILYERFDLDTDDGVLRGMEQLIELQEPLRRTLGGLGLATERIERPDGLLPSSWRFSFQFDQLLSVIWYQMIRAIVRRSYIRTCRNEKCPSPASLFVANRPNQYYCGPQCRNYHNTQKHRSKTRELTDFLP